MISSINQKFPALMAVLALLAIAASAPAATIQNDTFWKDQSGNFIFSQGGGIIKVGPTYYWYGVNYVRAAAYAANPADRTKSRSGFQSVTCYSSTDLANWKFEGNALSQDQAGRGWFGRIGVVYNSLTKKYVLIGQGGGPRPAAFASPSAAPGPQPTISGTMARPRGGMYFATSDTPVGPFKFDHVQTNLPSIANGGTGDQTTFQDDDGSAYVICSCKNGRNQLYVATLRPSDFLNVDSATEISRGPGREGNCMFKYKGRYYFCSSNLHGWNASPTYAISSTNILGPYGPESVIKNTDLDFSHVTQSGFFVTVNGSKQTTVIFAGDRWSDFGGNGIGYNQWCPLSFDGTNPVFNSLSQWNLDAATGTWSVGPANNYILNPGFEADRVSQRELAGWSNTSNINGADPNGNIKDVAHTGNFCMQQTYSTDYTATMSQNITGIPNGTYTLSAWVKSSGGQNSAVIGAQNFGACGLTYSIARPIADWTLVSIPGINITNGACQVAIASDAKANNWVQVDDVSLVNSASAPQERPPLRRYTTIASIK